MPDRRLLVFPVVLLAASTAALAAPPVTLRGGNLEVTIRPDGCGLLDEVKYRNEVVLSATDTGHAPALGYREPADRPGRMAQVAAALGKADPNAPCKVTTADSARGHELVIIENGLLKVTIVPFLGGRIIRMDSRLTGMNLVASPYEDERVTKAEDVGGIWGNLPSRIFEVKVLAGGPDEGAVLLTADEEETWEGNVEKRQVVKTVRLLRGYPGLLVEQRLIATQRAQTVNPEIIGRFCVGPAVGREDSFWVASRGRAVCNPWISPWWDLCTAADPRVDHWAALCDTQEGASLLSVFEGPVSALSGEFRSLERSNVIFPYHAIEHRTMDTELQQGQEVRLACTFLPCFNLDSVAFADRNVALGILPECDVIAHGAQSWNVKVFAVGFTQTPAELSLTPRLVDRHGAVVRSLQSVKLKPQYLIAETRHVAWQLGELAPGDYTVEVAVSVGGTQVGATALSLKKAQAGPLLTLFEPAPGEDPLHPMVGQLHRARIEVQQVQSLDTATAEVRGVLRCPDAAWPYTTRVSLDPAADALTLGHTLTPQSLRPGQLIQAAGLALPLGLGGELRKNKTVVGGEKLNDTWRVDQTDELSNTLLLSDFLARWPLWEIGGFLQDGPSHYRIWKAAGEDVGPTTTLEGTQAPGWVDVMNARWGVRVSLPEVAKTAPKGIVANGITGVVQAFMYPPQVPPLRLASSGDPAAPSLADRLGVRAGAPWACQVRLQFHPGPHPYGFQRGLSEEAFRKLLEAYAGFDARVLGIAARPTGPEVIQDILDSDLTARQFMDRMAIEGGYRARWRLEPVCKRLGMPWHNEYLQDYGKFVNDVLLLLGATQLP